MNGSSARIMFDTRNESAAGFESAILGGRPSSGERGAPLEPEAPHFESRLTVPKRGVKTKILTVLVVLVIIIAAPAAAADNVTVIPINPTAGAVVHRDVRFVFAIQTNPSAICAVDVASPGGRPIHLPFTRADGSGVVSWSNTYFTQPGISTATAVCRLGNDLGKATWTYIVE